MAVVSGPRSAPAWTLALAAALLLLPASAAMSAARPAADATVAAVSTSGRAGAYTFDVTIHSNDTGMEHYADWWEVVDASGHLIYRRVLLHDHADEQPFSRDGGPVNVKADDVVTVRAHVYPDGYAAAAMRGSAAAGFKPVELEAGYAADLEKQPPLPAH